MTRALATLGAWLLLSASAFAALPSSAPNLAAPTGDIVTVSTAAQLLSAAQNIVSGRTIVLNPGTYSLATIGPLFFNAALTNIALRGSTNNYDDVVLQGAGMLTQGPSDFGVWFGGGVNGVLIANLTIRDVYFSPVQINTNAAAIHLYHVRLLDAGQQFVKSTQGGGNNNCIVEYSTIEYTTTSRNTADPYVGYTNGVDAKGDNWIIRHNLFRNIKAPGALAGPAILAWQGSTNVIVEGNTFIACQREIALGLQVQSGFNDNSGGIVRNNFLYRPVGQTFSDVAIGLADSPNTKVYNNSVLINGTYSWAIEYRFTTTTGVIIRNNLTDGAIQLRDGASGTVNTNLLTATPSFFVSPTTGDLHLLSSAATAIDDGVTLTADVPTDWDGQARLGAYDLGADELVASTGVLRLRIRGP